MSTLTTFVLVDVKAFKNFKTDSKIGITRVMCCTLFIFYDDNVYKNQ